MEIAMNVVYGSAISPFVRKVLMLLDYKGIAYEQVNVPPRSTEQPFAKISPLGKIPAFADEYTTLADSSVICDYLEHKYPQRPLYPKTPVERAKALWFEEYADSHLFQLLGPGLYLERVVNPLFFRRPANEKIVANSLKALPAALDYLEPRIPASGFLVGVELTIADLILPGVFANAVQADYSVDARKWPRLAAYLQRMFEHPLYAKHLAHDRALLEAVRSRR